MVFLFNRGRRQPSDIVKLIKDLLLKLRESPDAPKIEEDLEKQLGQLRLVVQGTQDVEPKPEEVEMAIQTAVHEDLVYELARGIRLLPFQARKDTQTVFSQILRFKTEDNDALPPLISYIVHHRPEVIIELCRGYAFNHCALQCGAILREALKFDIIAAIILYDQSIEGEPAVRITEVDPDRPQDGHGVFWKFFGWIDKGSFEVSADVFTTFRNILLNNKPVTTGYVEMNFELFFTRFNESLIKSESYVTKRQSTKLLGEILLDRAYYRVMIAYVARWDNLKLCMTLLKDDQKMIQYEGFHVFKVFVANPNKSMEVQRLLINNRQRLLKFLPRFLEDRTDDDQFNDEKSFLLRQIQLLPDEPVDPSAAQ
ncbi:Conidiophore development protein hymA [Aspergillus sp. HF37]|nr:Conidiophore development protein hymA [Aspergillus sp. HF37]